MPVHIDEVTVTAEVQSENTRGSGTFDSSQTSEQEMKLLMTIEELKRIIREKNER